MTFSVSHGAGYAVVAVAGEIDIVSQGQFRDRLSLVLAGDVRRLAVDLSGVTFMASAGLAVLTGLHRAMTAEGGSLVLVSPRGEVAQIVSLTGLDRVIPVLASMLDAVALWSRDGGSTSPPRAE